ncbi:PREDICTED: uncharacterized protein LOC104814896 [Tarenaya hassleriana]|uniref:uncharacterized protein LOC104814896 n=1 Tax=Tarenaya hassleriana TaxID=28532 RepID=UPI00053C4BC8|nr:PREDICTED: uncharacterized protein LOC104814896 [Tarenaya hassleriana]XP_010541428.1 PREDICTED: uncharacterized protein LOC104814896 [Tarenaya hassleriana]XP_010541429.1 PREDICTED: uncharacterized protein LOC104814896 [Tarenaya hassleriana]
MESHLNPREALKEQQLYRISSSKPLQTPTEQCMKTQAGGERELVKYMSNLPVFLERIETPNDKLLNVGVLNWGRLEKWQHCYKHASEKGRLPSVSRREVQNQRTQHHSLQFHLMSDPPEEGSQIAKSYGECVKECQNRKTIPEINFKDHHCFSIRDEQLLQGMAPGSDRCENNDKICPKNESLSNGSKPEFGLKVEIKSKTRKHRHGKRDNELKGSNQNDHEGDIGRKLQGASELRHPTKKLDRKETKTPSRRSLAKETKEVCHVELDYSARHSYSLPCEADNCRSDIGSRDADRSRVLVKITLSVPLTEMASASSSHDKITQDKRSGSVQGPVSKLCNVPSEKGRTNVSPFQRLSFSTGKTSKHNSERDAVPVTRQDSMVNSSKSGSQNTATSSGCNKPCGKDRAAISPFRRLLEPLLKPKDNSLEDPRAQGVQRVKSGVSGCKMVNVDDSAREKKPVSFMVQAVLRVTVKNNQLLFTFAVNKERDVLAATLKKLGSLEENECTTSMYNFFSIHEHKKNGVWLNQRSKGQTHGIISNVFAQMRISSSPSGSIREFVLFSVDLGKGNEEKSDLQLKNELAAIVINSNAQIKDRNGPVLCDRDISATVITQSGVHSLPHKGGPSSLIQRWRSGGSCDCGGWDMGCNLRVLTNCSSKNTASSDRFQLFLTGGKRDEQPFLSLAPIKEGIYSVGYNSPLSLLQAFSICIAVVECRKLGETSENKGSYYK